MKKIISILLVGIILLTLMGCKENEPTPDKSTPEGTVSSLIEDIKANNMENIKKHPFASDIEKFQESLTKDSPISKETVLSIFSNIEYQITDSKISGDGKTAVVNVSITNSDFGEAFAEWLKNIRSIVNPADDEKEMVKIMLESFEKHFKEAKEKDPKTIETKVKLTKKDDDTWEISKKGNDDFANALTGNMIETTKELFK